MNKIINFEPRNDPKKKIIKEYFSIISKQKKCSGIPCEECPFKNIQRENSICLANTLLSQNEGKNSEYIFSLAIDYYKYFYTRNIVQETFEV